jgi:hypothetical protein
VSLEQSGTGGEFEKLTALPALEFGCFFQDLRDSQRPVQSAKKVGFVLSKAEEIPGRWILQDLEGLTVEGFERNLHPGFKQGNSPGCRALWFSERATSEKLPKVFESEASRAASRSDQFSFVPLLRK